MLSTNLTITKYAKIAGLLYLLSAVIGGFSIGYVPSVLIESENAAITTQNITENINLYLGNIF